MAKIWCTDNVKATKRRSIFMDYCSSFMIELHWKDLFLFSKNASNWRSNALRDVRIGILNEMLDEMDETLHQNRSNMKIFVRSVGQCWEQIFVQLFLFHVTWFFSSFTNFETAQTDPALMCWIGLRCS